MTQPQRAGSLLESFRYAFAGLRYAFTTQRNIRVQSTIGGLALVASVLLKIPLHEVAILALVSGLVISLEMVNTVFETIVDLVSPEYHPLAKIAKDVGAAAVITTAITSILVGLLLLGPPLFSAIFPSQ